MKKVMLGILALIIASGCMIYFYKMHYVGEMVNPFVYFDEFKGNTNNLVYEDKRIEMKDAVKEIEGELYVRYEFAHDYISDTIFYDAKEKIMTLTNCKQVIRLYEGDNTVEFSGIKGDYKLSLQDETLYISANLIKDLFNVTLEKSELDTLWIATNESISREQGTLKRSVSLRTHPRDKSVVVEKLDRNDCIDIYGEEDGFLRVRSEQGIVGYIPSTRVKEVKLIEAKKNPAPEPYPLNPLNATVRLIWDQMSTNTEKDWSSGKYRRLNNINVLSPTWFQFEDEAGKLSNIAISSYIKEAHRKDIEVWPILSHNFSDPALTKPVLSSTKARGKVIEQLINFAKEYKFDGINIDIENIQEDISAEWVQFMRELYPRMKEQGLKVSVDVYTPSNWSTHYEREKIAQSCDYFMVMAYDQHWSGSEEAGSVAELPWVEQSIQKTLEEVPSEKLVLGMPFYTRLWVERENGLNVKNYTMTSIQDLIASWKVQPILDPVSGQNYVEYSTEDGLYKVWLEDEYSIQKRLDLMKKYNLAGYGAWRLGYENAPIWDILSKVE